MPVEAARVPLGRSAINGVAKPTIGITPSLAAGSQKSAPPKTTTAAKAPAKRAAVAKKTYSATRAAARRVRVARARAAAEREARALATPRYKTDDNGSLVPAIGAAAAIVYNPLTHEVLWEENANDARSIASITKVMTAVVFLEH
jgi:D-alanyl-D-alanine endopeptidase (penicillin-binding protein 7)